jgi:hypothetical protein
VPWNALRAAVRRTVPGTAIVWSQQPGTADPAALLALARRFPPPGSRRPVRAGTRHRRGCRT